MSGFEDCVHDHMLGGVITPEEGEDLLNRFAEDMKRMGRKGAQDNLAKTLEFMSKIKRMDQANSVRVTNEWVRDLTNYKDAFGRSNIVAAIKEKFEDTGYSGFKSAKRAQEAYIGIANSMAAKALEKFQRTKITGKRMNANLNLELAKAMRGEAADPAVKEAAEGFKAASDYLVDENNRYGGFIPKLEGYFPQSHNEYSVANFGGKKIITTNGHLNAWRDFIGPLLAWDRMYDPLTGELFDPKTLTAARKASILEHVFYSIITNGASDLSPALRPKGLGIRGAGTDHRFLIFKDATSQEKYNVEAGRGDAITSMMSHLHSLARDAGLKEIFGPSPPARVEWAKQMVALHGALKTRGKPNLMGAYKDNADMTKVAERAGHTFDAFYNQFRGEKPTDNALTWAGTVLSNWSMSALLGSSSIPHAMSNWYIQTLQRKIAGMPWAATIPQILASFSKASHHEMLYAALDNEDGAFNLGSGARQISGWKKFENFTRYLPDRTVHWSGLMAVVEANKAAFNKGMMAYVGRNIDKPWDNVDPKLKARLMASGIKEADWKLWRLAKTYESYPGGAKWLRGKEIADASVERPGEVLNTAGYGAMAQPELEGGNSIPQAGLDRARDIMRTAMANYIAFLKSEQAIAVPQGSLRVKASLVGSTDRGTPFGFLLHSFSMFKGFIGHFGLTQAAAFMQSVGKGYGKAGAIGGSAFGAAYAARVAVVLTVLGALTLQLKTMSTGKDPFPMDPSTPQGRAFWGHALLTGGALSIFGDFLAADRDSYGHGPLETAAGPVASVPIDLWGFLSSIYNNATGPKQQKVPLSLQLKRSILKAVGNQTPVLTTFAPLRAAYQRWVLDTLQKATDPLAHAEMARKQVRLEKETGQQYYWKPGELLPSRLPHWSGQ